jgi:hypothetical protein
MVKEIFFYNGRRTWGLNTPAVIKALEKQFGSKVKSVGGKAPARVVIVSKKTTKPTNNSKPKRNLSRDRMFVSNEKHELAYIKKHPNSGRTGYKGVKKAKKGMHVVGSQDEYNQVIPKAKFKKGDKAVFENKTYTLPEPSWFAYMKEYSYKLPGKGEIVLEYELAPLTKANPGLLVAMELQKQKAEKDAKKQEFKDAHGGKEQWELDIPKQYQEYKGGGQLSDRDQAFYDLVDEYMNESPGMNETVAQKLAYDELGYYPKYSVTQYKGGGRTIEDYPFMVVREYHATDELQAKIFGLFKKYGIKIDNSATLPKPKYGQEFANDEFTEFDYWFDLRDFSDRKAIEKSFESLEKKYPKNLSLAWTPTMKKAEHGAKTSGPIEYDTKSIKGQAKTHKKNTHFAFHKPSKSMVFSWDYKGYERDELYSYGGDDYFWTDVRDQADYMVDKFRKQDFEIITRQNLAKKGYDLDDYKVFQGQKYDKAEKGAKTPGKKEYIVMNNTDGITASMDSFKTVAQAKKFIADFPKRYEAQGYYRNNKWEKMDPKDVELEVVQIDPNKLEFGTGGIILAGLIAGYVGYKVGRARPQKVDFTTEKKIGRTIKAGAKATAEAVKKRKEQKQNK